MQEFRAFHSAQRTIQGIEIVNMICKGQVRWLAKGDIVGQVAFVDRPALKQANLPDCPSTIIAGFNFATLPF
jgi:hypothetical protein